MVPGGRGEGETADRSRYHRHHPVETGQDVQRHRIQGHQDCVQAICFVVLHYEHWKRGQRVDHAGVDPEIRRDHGQGVRKRVRARHRVQLPAGVLHPRRAHHRREHPGVVLDGDTPQAQDV